MATNRLLNVSKADSSFSALVAEQLIQAYLRKRIGGNPSVLVNEIRISEKDKEENSSDIYIHLDLEAVLPKSAIVALLSGREISCS